MRCPKEKQSELQERSLEANLSGFACPCCQGVWIPADNYAAWQRDRGEGERLPAPSAVLQAIDLSVSPYDGKAGLCPECGSYLTRARLESDPAFYLERCPHCGGIWCDRGEWQALVTLQLHGAIPHLFSSQWQAEVRRAQLLERDRQRVMATLGTDLAAQLFSLADALERLEGGEVGVAYLMRRFERER